MRRTMKCAGSSTHGPHPVQRRRGAISLTCLHLDHLTGLDRKRTCGAVTDLPCATWPYWACGRTRVNVSIGCSCAGFLRRVPPQRRAVMRRNLPGNAITLLWQRAAQQSQTLTSSGPTMPQGYDLGIDSRLGNCVYCFMKGAPALAAIARDESAGGLGGARTPSRLGWWAELERRYAGPSHGGGNFKFLSLTAPSYEQISVASGLDATTQGPNMTPVVIESRRQNAADEPTDSAVMATRSWVPCECTD